MARNACNTFGSISSSGMDPPRAPAGPLGTGAALRLTYNPGTDLAPLWLPGGSGAGGILYTAERVDRADHDRCFAILPPAGGAIERYVCRTSAADDSVDVFENAAL